MKLKLLLDTGVLSEICHGKVERPVRGWFERISQRHDVLLSDVADYEVRGELVRSKALRGLALLDGMPVRAQRLRMTDATWLRAATLWAQLVPLGRPPAKGIAGDVHLAAQADLEGATVVTYNLKDFADVVSASLWTNVPIA